MIDEDPIPTPPQSAAPRRREDLPPAAQRALAEAEARRAAGEAERVHAADLPPEVNGRKGAEPVRYGDWEKNGIAYDF